MMDVWMAVLCSCTCGRGPARSTALRDCRAGVSFEIRPTSEIPYLCPVQPGTRTRSGELVTQNLKTNFVAGLTQVNLAHDWRTQVADRFLSNGSIGVQEQAGRTQCLEGSYRETVAVSLNILSTFVASVRVSRKYSLQATGSVAITPDRGSISLISKR